MASQEERRSNHSDHQHSAGVADDRQEIRVVLVGQAGMGKSELGNSLLHKKVFKSSSHANTGTTHCAIETSSSNHNKELTIVDTPGLTSVNDTCLEIKRCMELLKPGPHIFILVLSVNNRFAGDEIDTYKLLKRMFGFAIVPYIMVVFTGMDSLENDDEELQDYLKDKPEIKCLLQKFDNRYIGINNVTSKNKDEEVNEVIRLIENTININNRSNRCEYFTSNIQGIDDSLGPCICCQYL